MASFNVRPLNVILPGRQASAAGHEAIRTANMRTRSLSQRPDTGDGTMPKGRVTARRPNVTAAARRAIFTPTTGVTPVWMEWQRSAVRGAMRSCQSLLGMAITCSITGSRRPWPRPSLLVDAERPYLRSRSPSSSAVSL